MRRRCVDVTKEGSRRKNGARWGRLKGVGELSVCVSVDGGCRGGNAKKGKPTLSLWN